MKKRLFGLLLVLALCIGLLPVVALADEAAPTKVELRILSWVDIAAEEGGAVGYLKNSEYQGYDAEGKELAKGWTQVKGDADNWNIKFEWPAGGVPTLTIKDAKLVMVTEDGKMLYKKSTDSETGEVTYKSQNSVSAILPKSGAANCIDLNLVVEGDNQVLVNNGIIRGYVGSSQHFNNITITGKNGGKLSGRGGGIGISAASGYNLTFDSVNIDLKNTTVGGGTPIPIRTTKGNITFKNSTIKCGNTKNVAIFCETSGDIHVIDSTINVNSQLSSTAGSACLNTPNGTITIEGNKTHITALGKNNPCLSAKKIVINGGVMDFTSAYYAVYTKAAEDCTINGGTVNIMAERAFYSAFVKGSGVMAYAGASADSCEEYDGADPNLAKKPWMLITNDSSKFIEITEPTEEEIPIFTVPSTPVDSTPTTTPTTPNTPTTPSTPAGNATQTPGGNDSQGGSETKAPNGDKADGNTDGKDSEEGSSNLILWIIIAVVVLGAGGAIAFILIKRKKA